MKLCIGVVFVAWQQLQRWHHTQHRQVRQVSVSRQHGWKLRGLQSCSFTVTDDPPLLLVCLKPRPPASPEIQEAATSKQSSVFSWKWNMVLLGLSVIAFWFYFQSSELEVVTECLAASLSLSRGVMKAEETLGTLASHIHSFLWAWRIHWWDEISGEGLRHKAICFHCISVMLRPTSSIAGKTRTPERDRETEAQKSKRHLSESKFDYLSSSVTVGAAYGEKKNLIWAERAAEAESFTTAAVTKSQWGFSLGRLTRKSDGEGRVGVIKDRESLVRTRWEEMNEENDRKRRVEDAAPVDQLQ